MTESSYHIEESTWVNSRCVSNGFVHYEGSYLLLLFALSRHIFLILTRSHLDYMYMYDPRARIISPATFRSPPA